MKFFDFLTDNAAGIGAVASISQIPLQLLQNQQNYGLQKENLGYQKALQQMIFQREDNAIQRRVADLKKAGLNPLLAAGSAAGSGSVVPTVAPQIAPMDFMTPLSTAQSMLESQSRIKSSNQSILESIARIKQIDSNIVVNESQVALNAQKMRESAQSVIESNQRIKESEVRIFAQTLQNELTKKQIEQLSKNIELIEEQVLSERQRRDIEAFKWNFDRETGFPTGTDNDIIKIFQGAFYIFKRLPEFYMNEIGIPFSNALIQAMKAVGWIDK